jgi:[acyl-carrier-protein] S-malonyltransferase
VTAVAASTAGKTAFVFPGQGSQKVGMGRALADAYSESRAVFAEVDEALGYSLSKLCFDGPELELTLTANAQPAILATSVAALRALEARSPVRPSAVAGHSLGEYSALVAAGALGLADAVRLVHLRGKFMQDAVPAGLGAMAAIIGLSAEDVTAVCREAAGAEVVSAANLNGGGQVVIAGHKGAVDRACAVAKTRGAKRAIPLTVSAPFHCALMQPAADRLASELARVDVKPPEVPVVSNVEAKPNQDAARVKDLLARQVTAPVRWEESVQCLAALGVDSVVEVGAGNVLGGLVRRIAPDIAVHAAGDPASIEAFAHG